MARRLTARDEREKEARRTRFNKRAPKSRRTVEIDIDELEVLKARAARTPSNEAVVFINSKLLASVNSVLESTGSSVADYLELQLIKFTRNKAIHGLNDKLTFGQYEGLEVMHVCQTDLSYMHWLVVEQKSNKFKPEVKVYVEGLAADEDRSDCHLTWDDIR